jgi:hypothetical protein
MTSGGWKLHQRAAPPLEHFTVCGLPTTGKSEPIVVSRLVGSTSDCRNCQRKLASAKLEPADEKRKEDPK